MDMHQDSSGPIHDWAERGALPDAGEREGMFRVLLLFAAICLVLLTLALLLPASRNGGVDAPGIAGP